MINARCKSTQSSNEARSAEASTMGRSWVTLRQFEVKTNVFGNKKNEKLRIISSSTKGINELMCIRSPPPPEAIKCRGNFGDKNWPDGINYLFIFFVFVHSPDRRVFFLSLKKTWNDFFVVFIQFFSCLLAALRDTITQRPCSTIKLSTDNTFCCRFVSFF